MKKKLMLTMMGLILSANLCAKELFVLSPKNALLHPQQTARALKEIIDGAEQSRMSLNALNKKIQLTVNDFKIYSEVLSSASQDIKTAISADIVRQLSIDLEMIKAMGIAQGSIVAKFNKNISQTISTFATNMEELIKIMNVIRKSLTESKTLELESFKL